MCWSTHTREYASGTASLTLWLRWLDMVLMFEPCRPGARERMVAVRA